MARISARSDDGAGGEQQRDPVGTAINPADVVTTGTGTDTGDVGGDQPRRRRGRPPGSGSGSARKSEKIRAAALEPPAIEAALTGIHALLAGLTEAKELELAKGEAEALATGICNVARHYEFLSGVGQKWVDVYNLAIIAGTIYGGKVLAIRHRLQHGSVTPTAASPARNQVPVPTDLYPVEIPGPDIIH